MDSGLELCRTRGILKKRVQDRSDAGQKGYSTAGMQDRWDARSGGMQHRTGRMQDRRDSGQEGCRTCVIQDRCDARK